MADQKIRTFKYRYYIAVMIWLILAACSTENPLPFIPLQDATPQNHAWYDGLQVQKYQDHWWEIQPGGDTRCARDTEFAFFVRKGDPDNLLIDFQGGGACWSEFTCSLAPTIFNEDIENTREKAGFYRKGIYDHSNPDNPFRTWTHIHVPYCTADLHWGNRSYTYGSGENAFTIHHHGATNVRSVIKFLDIVVPKPKKIFITGCSAGGYGSVVWATHLMEKYPDIQITQLSDSAAGVVSKEFIEKTAPKWDIEHSLPIWIRDLHPDNIDYSTLELTDIYRIIGKHYPNHTFSQYNTEYDSVQVQYYSHMNGGGKYQWSASMQRSIEDIHEKTDNFHSIIDGGDHHCFIMDNRFYKEEVNGVKMVDWIQDLIDSKTVPNLKFKKEQPVKPTVADATTETTP